MIYERLDFLKMENITYHKIYPGLLVGLGEYAIRYDVIVADAGLLSKENIKILAGNGYTYIIGARPKTAPSVIKSEILSANLKEKSAISFKQAAALIHTIYQLSIMVPESKRIQAANLKGDDRQPNFGISYSKTIRVSQR